MFDYSKKHHQMFHSARKINYHIIKHIVILKRIAIADDLMIWENGT